MSETNNNTPMRITQLEEATAYEDGMYYAVAKVGSGTKKIDVNEPNAPLKTVIRESGKRLSLLRKDFDSETPSGADSTKVIVTDVFNCNEKPLYFYYKNTIGTFLACQILNCDSEGNYLSGGTRLDTLSGGEASQTILSGYIRIKFWLSGGAAISDTNKKKIENSIKYILYFGVQDYNQSHVNLTERISDSETNINDIERMLQGIIVPILRNGSVGNTLNTDAICTVYVSKIDHDKNSCLVEFLGDTSLANEYAFAYVIAKGNLEGMTTTSIMGDSSIVKTQYNSNADKIINKPFIRFDTKDFSGFDYIAFALFRSNNGQRVPLRIAADQYCLRITYVEESSNSYKDNDEEEANHFLEFSKHNIGNSGNPLVLLHFSDLHKDTQALSRIKSDAGKITPNDIICTGDMVYYQAEQISSWWDSDILTCIGNHDSAIYSSETGYDWTGLSMADRDSYYIAPFEASWNIVHTSGTSYYYKDYNDSKVRLIVLDAMLYNNVGADAENQTTWLEQLLSDAITNNFHVIIAIHSPHGGSTAFDCSFSKYNQTDMPIYEDCNTPSIVIDTVSDAINNGLNFIGYIVGHTHQDNIWNATSDGKQKMYCVTTAATYITDLWKNSDQFRDSKTDAYNIIIIDTNNTLIKIIRGGGANMDNKSRIRKSITFNYHSGEMIGELL